MSHAWFALKIVLSGCVIALASSLAGRRPVLAGFIVALPLMSMLSLLFSYAEYRDLEKSRQFALSILTAVPLSLLFFLPFLLCRWTKWNFAATYAAGIVCVAAAYLLHSLVTKRIF